MSTFSGVARQIIRLVTYALHPSMPVEGDMFAAPQQVASASAVGCNLSGRREYTARLYSKSRFSCDVNTCDIITLR